MKKKVLLTLISISLFACKKSENENKQKSTIDIPRLIVGGEIDPEGFIQAYSFYNGDYHQYQFYAYFKNHPDDQFNVDVDSVIANNNYVPIYPTENNNYKLSLESSSGGNWLNDTLDIYIKGLSNFVSQDIKHPNLEEFTSLTLNGVTGNNNTHNKSNPLTINWNQGNLSNNIVYIELVFIEDALNNNGITTIKEYIEVLDNGTYTLPASFFNAFPTNSLCLINIYRGNYDNYTASNDKHIGVLTYSKATQKISLQ